MKIRHVEIRNFRGIQNLVWAIPDEKVVCLIGRGDSCKSTILEAIRFALYPSWNPSFGEFDFHDGNTEQSIVITVTIGELDQGLLAWQKFGQSLRGWNLDTRTLSDEPGDGLEDVLSVRLVVDRELEPKWDVYRPQDDEHPSISQTDRGKIGAAYLGAHSDRNLTWGKYSALSRITEAANVSGLLLDAMRTARESLSADHDKLDVFNVAAAKVEKLAVELGVPVSSDGAFCAQLDNSALGNQTGNLALHDKHLPLRHLGLGSRRILTVAVQREGQTVPGISLIDELEIGLEPHRVARTVNFLVQKTAGQAILTTHSPVVLRELSVKQLVVVRKQNGLIKISDAALSGLESEIQGKMRRSAESFLAEKIIVCEGATEVGVCRAIDEHLQSNGYPPFSFVGATTFDAGGGASVKLSALACRALGYEVAVIVDSDSEGNFSEEDLATLRAEQVHTTYWEGGLSIEQFVFRFIEWEAVKASVVLVISDGEQSIQGVVDAINGRIKPDSVNTVVEDWQDSEPLRKAIGDVATKKDWFKRVDKGEAWGRVILGKVDQSSELEQKLSALKNWIHNGVAD